MRVLVCGGRDYADARKVFEQLDGYPVTTLIEGGARGADALARKWANERGIDVETYPADWGAHGRAAGPIRNETMLRAGKPDMVLAFPGGRGTADMMRRADQAGVRVQRVSR